MLRCIIIATEESYTDGTNPRMEVGNPEEAAILAGASEGTEKRNIIRKL